MFQASELDAREAVRVLSRRRGYLLGSVLACVALALCVNELTPPVYRSASRLAIRTTPSRSPLTDQAVETPTPNSENLSLLTTAERILGRDVLERVVLEMRDSGVTVRPEPARLSAGVGVLAARGGPGRPADADLRDDVDRLLDHASVRPIRDTRLVDVRVEHPDPRAAAAIANSIARQFVRGEDDQRRAADAARLVALRAQIDDVRTSIERAEWALYGSNRAGLALADERNRQLAGSASEVGSALLKLRAERRAVETQLAHIRRFRSAASPDWNAPPVQTAALDDLFRQYQRAVTDAEAQRHYYKEGSPEIDAARSQVDALRAAMRRELAKAASDLEGQRQVMLARERGLGQTAASNEQTLRALSDSAYKYSTLASRLTTQRDVYAQLLKRVQELEIAQTIEPASVEVAQAAVVPLRTVRPRKALNLALATILGLLFGSGLALARESLRRTIRTPRDVVQALQLPVVGMIPRRP